MIDTSQSKSQSEERHYYPTERLYVVKLLSGEIINNPDASKFSIVDNQYEHTRVVTYDGSAVEWWDLEISYVLDEDMGVYKYASRRYANQWQ